MSMMYAICRAYNTVLHLWEYITNISIRSWNAATGQLINRFVSAQSTSRYVDIEINLEIVKSRFTIKTVEVRFADIIYVCGILIC